MHQQKIVAFLFETCAANSFVDPSASHALLATFLEMRPDSCQRHCDHQEDCHAYATSLVNNNWRCDLYAGTYPVQPVVVSNTAYRKYCWTNLPYSCNTRDGRSCEECYWEDSYQTGCQSSSNCRTGYSVTDQDCCVGFNGACFYQYRYRCSGSLSWNCYQSDCGSRAECTPRYSCGANTGGTSCVSCPDTHYRMQDNHCSSCNPGYELDGYDCRPISCATGDSGEACASCRDQEERTHENQCTGCNSGYYLREFDSSCQPYTCNPNVGRCNYGEVIGTAGSWYDCWKSQYSLGTCNADVLSWNPDTLECFCADQREGRFCGPLQQGNNFTTWRVAYDLKIEQENKQCSGDVLNANGEDISSAEECLDLIVQSSACENHDYFSFKSGSAAGESSCVCAENCPSRTTTNPDFDLYSATPQGRSWVKVFGCEDGNSTDRLLFTVEDLIALAEDSTRVKLCESGTSNCYTSKTDSFPITRLSRGRAINILHPDQIGGNLDIIQSNFQTTEPNWLPLEQLMSVCDFSSAETKYRTRIGDGEQDLVWACGQDSGVCVGTGDGACCSGGRDLGWDLYIDVHSGCATCQPQHSRLGHDHCATCDPGFYVDNQGCVPYECTEAESGPGCKTCVPLSSRSEHQQCLECHVGYRLIGTACIQYTCTTGDGDSCAACLDQEFRSKDDHCSECNPGFHLEDGECHEYECITGDGALCSECLPQEQRQTENECTVCNAGYYLLNEVCVPWDCDEGDDHRCQQCVELGSRSFDNHCESCNIGYYLNETTYLCDPFDCVTGEDSGCRICAPQGHRTKENYCEACNPGYYLYDGACEPHTCQEGNGTLCESCLPQDARTNDFACASCNAGHSLQDDSSCIAFECTTNSDSLGCRTCKPQIERVRDYDCASCNLGSYLTSNQDTVCQPWDCTTGSDDSCKVCQAQVDRRGPDHCLECNGGHYLKFSTPQVQYCEPYTCATGSGSLCASCKEVSLRTKENDCDTCVGGYYLEDFECKPYTCDLNNMLGCSACVDLHSRTDFDQCGFCHWTHTLIDDYCVSNPTSAPTISVPSASPSSTPSLQPSSTPSRPPLTEDGSTVVTVTSTSYANEETSQGIILDGLVHSLQVHEAEVWQLSKRYGFNIEFEVESESSDSNTLKQALTESLLSLLQLGQGDRLIISDWEVARRTLLIATTNALIERDDYDEAVQTVADTRLATFESDLSSECKTRVSDCDIRIVAMDTALSFEGQYIVRIPDSLVDYNTVYSGFNETLAVYAFEATLDSGIIAPPTQSPALTPTESSDALETSESKAWHEVDPWLQYAVFGVFILICCFCSFIAYRHVSNRKLKYEVRKEQLDQDIAAMAAPFEYQVEGHAAAGDQGVEEHNQFDGFIPTGKIDCTYDPSTHKEFDGITNPGDSSTHKDFDGMNEIGIPTIGMEPDFDSSSPVQRKSSFDSELYGEGVSKGRHEGTQIKKREPKSSVDNSDYIVIDGDETAPTIGASQKKLDLIVLHQDTDLGEQSGEMSPNGVNHRI